MQQNSLAQQTFVISYTRKTFAHKGKNKFLQRKTRVYLGKIYIFSFDYLSNWIFALNNLSLVNGEFSKFYFIVALASPCFSKKPHASCHICIHVLICVNYCLTVNGKIAHNLVTVFIWRMCGIKPLSSNSSLTSKPPT